MSRDLKDLLKLEGKSCKSLPIGMQNGSTPLKPGGQGGGEGGAAWETLAGDWAVVSCSVIGTSVPSCETGVQKGCTPVIPTGHWHESPQSSIMITGLWDGAVEQIIEEMVQ